MHCEPKVELKLNDYTHMKMGKKIGENITSSIDRAENYIYIISPYVSASMIKKLHNIKKLKPNLDIKLLFADKKDFLNDVPYQNLFSELINYQWKEDTDKKNKNIETIKLLKNKIKNFHIFIGIFLVLLCCIYYFFRNIPKFLIPSYFLIIPLFFIGFFFFSNKIFSCKEKIKLIQNEKTVIPEFIKSLDFKFVKHYDGNDKPSALHFPHVKLFLMDFKANNGKTIKKAFWGSANFTYSGLNENFESIVETIDHNLVSPLQNFFDDMYALDFPLHHDYQIADYLFKKRLLKMSSSKY